MTIKFKDKNPAPLSLIIGLLISEAMDSASGQKINAGLKWPNDLLINKKKICGILIESEINADEVEFIVGIGINYSLPKKELWWGEIGELKDILPREKLINSILRGIISYKENGYQNWVDAWEKRCMHMGMELKAVLNNQLKAEIGIFNGINEEGMMLLQTATELKVISSGECSIKGIY
jgi:BirA family biotin operon repressor/biotin-[acetyl-CoA-carboxylase] ligase